MSAERTRKLVEIYALPRVIHLRFQGKIEGKSETSAHFIQNKIQPKHLNRPKLCRQHKNGVPMAEE